MNHKQLVVRLILFIASCLLRVVVASECFDQQYANTVADLRRLHIFQRVGIVAPLSAFYVYARIYEDEERPVRKENGERLVVYSSLSSSNIEWQPLHILASSVRIVPVTESQVEISSPVVIVNACPYETRPVYLDAQPFTVDTYSAGLVSMYENELTVTFRTYEDGIFFFSVADQGDMLVAQLVGGQVQALFDFGSLSRSVITGGRALNDGEWHEFRWSHQFDSVKLYIDGVEMNSTAPSGLYRKLDFNYEVEIGGRPDDQYSTEIETAYHGCLARVHLNNIDLLNFAPKTARNCQMPRPQTLSIRSGSFRLLPRPSTLLSIHDSLNVSLVELMINDNHTLVLEAESHQIRQVSLPAIHVTDGSWHALSIKLRGGRLDVDLNGFTVLWLEGAIVRKIGLKMTAFRLSAAGCYRSATVDLKSASVVHGAILRDHCAYVDKCLPNPCENGGVCVQTDLKLFRCDCGKYYTGSYCHTSLLPRSCEDYYLRRHKLKAENVTIDLDGGGPLKPFRVHCVPPVPIKVKNTTSGEQIDAADGATLLYHDIPNGMHVTGETEPGSVRRMLDYEIDGEVLDRFVEGFDDCRQYMRFECRGGTKLMTDVPVNDNEWHTIYWEVDPQTMKLIVDRREKTVSSFYVLPNTNTYIVGSRTGRGFAGYAGQIRNMYLCGREILLGQMVRKVSPMGLQLGRTGYCRQNRCLNGGSCIELYDAYKCNCSMTPFVGEKCEQEVGAWIPPDSQLSIPWQHPAQIATCYRMAVQTTSTNVSLIRSRALFAESTFNMSIDSDGHLQVRIYDGFFFNHDFTYTKLPLSDDKTKDIAICATKSNLKITINGEPAVLLEGNFTFFVNFNVWTFIDKNYTGCLSRLQVGSGFPLKSPNDSRLSYTDGVRFGGCPYDALQYYPTEQTEVNPTEIHISAIVKDQQRLLLITPAIGVLTALLLALGLCVFVFYVRSRPDGVYKTNEDVIAYRSPNKSAEPLVQDAAITAFTKEYFC
ncbi:Thrombospondin N-terminal -like domain containing protein [Aphelenchoides avenae]|nr:Thrombospondin N-terminal -like domain containing protein [Aphelenchus avenae]